MIHFFFLYFVLCGCDHHSPLKESFSPLVLSHHDRAVVVEDSLRVLVVGNSITRHTPLPELGWHHDWGMAASEKDKDFVHVLYRRINNHPKVNGKCVLRFDNVASYEGDYYTLGLAELHKRFHRYREFNPDLVIFRWGDNVSDSLALKHSFGKRFSEVITYFRRNPKKAPLFIITSTWYPHKTIINEQMMAAAHKHQSQYVNLGELRYVPAMSAEAAGLFKNGAVASHPSDRGMEAIADMIYKAFRDMVVVIHPDGQEVYKEGKK